MRVENGVAYIPLFGAEGAGKFAVVDEEDVPKVSSLRWTLAHGRTVIACIKRRYISMHDLVLPRESGKLILFKDGNSLNCRKGNLSRVSRAELSRVTYARNRDKIREGRKSV